MTDTSQWITIERRFAAPVAAVWAMWADPGLFKKWFGPNGMSVPVAQMDVKIGGTRKVCMQLDRPGQTMSMWFTGVYKEIDPPFRLVYTESMCQPDGTLISPTSMGMPEGTPDFTEVIVELKATEEGTHMKMTHVGIPEGSPGEGGWQQAFDKLSNALMTAG
ncbi:SRPBCC family protein [Roseovarius sp. 2305UL8-3]|uniref:SRPBCC family protein n=1 Tax=Roseovarius conchicola TaxID=3121636 RepID=UPI0035279EFC